MSPLFWGDFRLDLQVKLHTEIGGIQIEMVIVDPSPEWTVMAGQTQHNTPVDTRHVLEQTFWAEFIKAILNCLVLLDDTIEA